MRARFARTIGTLALVGALVGGISSAHAAPKLPNVIVCHAVTANYEACVFAVRFDKHVSVHEAFVHTPTYSKVYGVGLVCVEGEYVLIYQTGKSKTFHYQPLASRPNCVV